MWGDRQRRATWKKQAGVMSTETDVLVETPKQIRVEDAWVKPGLGAIVVQCPHPECYKDWYSPIGGTRIGRLIDGIEDHIARKHKGSAG
jgi:hypothetical protein